MKLYKEQCSIDTIRYDTRCYFNVRSKANMSQLNLPMRDISFSLTALLTFWNSLPAAVVLSPSVAVFKRNLATLTFTSFLRYGTLNSLIWFMCVYVFYVVYFTAM